MIHLRFCIPYLSFNKSSQNVKLNPSNLTNKSTSSSNSSNSSIILEKIISCRNISLECSQIQTPSELSTHFINLLLHSPLHSLIVNPFHCEINISIVNNNNNNNNNQENNQNNLLTNIPRVSKTSTDSKYHLHFSLKLNNLEVTPTIHQLEMLMESFCYLRKLSRRYKYLLLRPDSNPSKLKHNNIRQWWKYALVSILIQKNGNSIFYPKNNWKIEDELTIKPEISSKYIELYLKHLQYQSYQNLTPSNSFSSSQLELNLKKFLLTDTELNILEDYNRTLNWGTLLIFRLLSHQRLLEFNKGDIPVLNTKNTFWTSFVSVFSSGNGVSNFLLLLQNTGKFLFLDSFIDTFIWILLI